MFITQKLRISPTEYIYVTYDSFNQQLLFASTALTGSLYSAGCGCSL